MMLSSFTQWLRRWLQSFDGYWWRCKPRNFPPVPRHEINRGRIPVARNSTHRFRFARGRLRRWPSLKERRMAWRIS